MTSQFPVSYCKSELLSVFVLGFEVEAGENHPLSDKAFEMMPDSERS
jgi:hypothetical protein